jgi:hypothetical protein
LLVTLALVALSALLAGCAADAPAVDDASTFRPAPEVPPIDRLGRWDGSTFVPVTPGEVRSGDLYVLVHGWAPGYLGVVQAHRGRIPLLAWAPQAVDSQGETMFTDFLPLAAAITKDDPSATVLGFSWLDDSATAFSPLDAWKSEAATDLNGQRLAAALAEVEAPTFLERGGRIHLIGHSHGAKVVTVAAIALERPPEQLTLLDSPESLLARIPGAANHLEGYLPLLPIGRGPGETFVDNYYSLLGVRYDTFPALEDVVDVSLDPAQLSVVSLDGLMERHGYPVQWYADSANDLAAGVGFAWSPLVGSPPVCTVCFFRQDWVSPTGKVVPAHELRLERVTEAKARVRTPRRLEVQPLRGPATSTRPDGIVLSNPGQSLWQVKLDTGPDDLSVEFDNRFTAPSAGAQLGVWLDDRQVFAAAADWSAEGATAAHAVIDVTSADPGRHTLTAVLSRPANRDATARVILGGFEVQSEPGLSSPGGPLATEVKVALAALGVLALIGLLVWALRLRRRERTVEAATTP